MSELRIGQVIGLAPGAVEAYEKLHAEVWPEVLDRLDRSHVSNYTIFRDGLQLFSYFEYTGTDWATDEAAIAADPATRNWWALVGSLQVPVDHAGEGEWWHTLGEIFHYDGPERSHQMLEP